MQMNKKYSGLYINSVKAKRQEDQRVNTAYNMIVNYYQRDRIKL